MPLSKRIVYLKDFADDAAKLRKTWGKTDLYSTSNSRLDEYLGGGYGRQDGYEIVLLYGDTGIGKSTVALNFLKDPIEKGKNVGLLVLEDDGADVFIRLSTILGNSGTNKWIMQGETLHFMPQEDLVKSWNLDDLLTLIEDWFTNRNLDVILLDHLQFAFEGAEMAKQENEYIAQRIFMQKLNQMIKRMKKTIILVSHVNKNSTSKGMGKIVGSGSIAQASTKVIEIAEDKGIANGIRLWKRKSRFTKRRDYDYCMKLVDGKLEGQI